MTGDVFDWCFHVFSMSLFFGFAYASTYRLGLRLDDLNGRTGISIPHAWG